MLLHIHNEHTPTLSFSLQSNQPGQSTTSQCSQLTTPLRRPPASQENQQPPQMVQPPGQTTTPKFPGAEKLISVRIASSSRRNFAKNVAVLAFTEDERMSSNVKGVLEKKQLLPNWIQKIRDCFPLEGFEDHEKAWANCRRAIDEVGN